MRILHQAHLHVFLVLASWAITPHISQIEDIVDNIVRIELNKPLFLDNIISIIDSFNYTYAFSQKN